MSYTQCIIRDTARHSEKENHFILDDAHCITVGDQYTKKSVILQGMAWGHMPDFMIADEMKGGALISIEGRWIKSWLFP
jgi:DNA-binding transcriptional LysR family regulator